MRSVWRRAAGLAAPVVVEAELRTLMRTTDVLVAGVISPAAVAAVGVGDSFSRIMNRVGGGLGDATIAISSQDTGVEAYANRDEAITQAFVMGALVGLPFVLFGLTFSTAAVSLLGAEADVVRLGGQYLGIIMVAGPVIHLTFIGSRALQGTGDTRTPMYIRGSGNLLNLVGTVVLAFGLGPFPTFGVVGIAAGTLLGETVTALLFLAAIYRPGGPIQFVPPVRVTLARQIVRIALPRVGEGATIMIADLPFNAILLALGTEANAAYHIARRAQQQLLAPPRRGFGVAANILVGQALGEDVDLAFHNGVSTVGLSVLVSGAISVLLFIVAGPITGVFTADPATGALAIGFVQAFAVGGVFRAGYDGFRGGLRGGSDTRTPFIATLLGMFVFLVGTSYVGGLYLGYGVAAVSAAIVLDLAWRFAFAGTVYYRRSWIEHGTSLMRDRGSVASAVEGED